MIKFGIVGTGWRSEFFLRIAAASPERFEIVGLVTRNVNRARENYGQFGVPFFGSIEEMLSETRPLFVVSSVPWDANPGVLKALTDHGMPVLSETPPARTVAEMNELIALNGKIQVAEQYWAQPHHAARIAFANSGKMGKVSQAQISVCHGYHGISLIRRFLGIGYENCVVTGRNFASSIVKGRDRVGHPDQETVVTTDQGIAHFDFGDRLGVLDFTFDQYFSFIRGQRVLVRGERGEIVDERAVYLPDQLTPIRIRFDRIMTGVNGNLEGNYLKGIQAGESWIYRNPMAPTPLSDEELAIATCLLEMATYADGGPDFYSLAEACQDRYLDILMAQAIATGEPVQSETQVWVR